MSFVPSPDSLGDLPTQVLASALGVSSGLAMGKEGPMLHAGSIVAVIIGSQ